MFMAIDSHFQGQNNVLMRSLLQNMPLGVPYTTCYRTAVSQQQRSLGSLL